MKYTIGIDIGGTNTDVVLIDQEKKCIAFKKVITTIRLEDGVAEGIRHVIASVRPEDVEAIFIGTTHGLNALLSGESLLPVGLIRIAGHRPKISAGLRWNSALRSAVIRSMVTIDGGFECDGRPLTPFKREEMQRAVEILLAEHVEGFALVSCFGSLYPEHEQEACRCLREMVRKDFPVTLSHEMGGIGFLERENATLLNTALKKVISESFSSLEMVRDMHGLRHARLALSQNDGSQMTMDEAKAKPILTLSCGPMNSAKGGSLLSQQPSCVVVDIGGTSTDIAVVQNGFVKRSQGVLTIADVRMRFPSPDIVSFALGGGSVMDADGNVLSRSVGRNLFQESQAFGGETCTLTDAALLLGFVEIEGAVLSRITLDKETARKIFDAQASRIINAVRLVRGENTHLPCVLVGGGALLFQKHLSARLPGLVSLERESLTGVANAFGAAQSEISGQFDSVISLENRNEALSKAEAFARNEAIKRGADPERLRIGHVGVEPLAYSQGKLARVTVSAIGIEVSIGVRPDILTFDPTKRCAKVHQMSECQA